MTEVSPSPLRTLLPNSLLCLLALLALVLFFIGGPDYYSNRTLRQIWDAGHLPVFALWSWIALVYIAPLAALPPTLVGWVMANKPACLAASRTRSRVLAPSPWAFNSTCSAKVAQRCCRSISSAESDSGNLGTYILGAMVSTTIISMASTITTKAYSNQDSRCAYFCNSASVSSGVRVEALVVMR